jgi:hypothetical protein
VMNSFSLKTAKLLALNSLKALWSSFRDLLPIIITVGIFQVFVFQQELSNVGSLLAGLVMVVAGLALFISGLEMGLFPLGEQMARDFAKKGSVPWLLAFAFALGFGTVFAEPALIAVAQKASELVVVPEVADEMPITSELLARRQTFALTLRTVVALSVGLSLIVGVIRIIRGWPIHYFIIGGYLLVMLLTFFAPAKVIGLAYDAGGVTTSTITVPLTAALGVGLASCIKGRNPMLDGFGLIAFAALSPIIFVLLMGIIWT